MKKEDLDAMFQKFTIDNDATESDIMKRELALYHARDLIANNFVRIVNTYNLPEETHFWMSAFLYEKGVAGPVLWRVGQVFEVYYQYHKNVRDPIGYYWMSEAFRCLKEGFSGELQTDPKFDLISLTFEVTTVRPDYEEDWNRYKVDYYGS